MSTSPAASLVRATSIIEQARARAYEYLPLTGLGLTCLPSCIAELSDLKRLDLKGNMLQTIPEELFKLSGLIELDISRNRLTSVPAGIGALRALKRLSLSDNPISELPRDIGSLSRLVELYMFRNRLERLPAEVGNLGALRELYLWGNQLSSLPEQIGDLGALRVLNLVRNRLDCLPSSLGRLDRLEELYLQGNPALRIPAEVLGPTSSDVRYHSGKPADPKKILRFYFAPRPKPLLEARIIIVGDGNVGKTSLARQLVHQDFARETEEQTIGVAIESWSVPIREQSVRVNLWDFGGQEPMHAAHPYFFTERTLYVVVASARDAGVDERLDHWLRMVARFSKGARALAVVNKVDQHTMDVARRRLCLDHPALPSDPDRAFFPTSCTTGSGIDALRIAITDQLTGMNQIWDQIPGEYFVVKEEIARLRSVGLDTVSFDRWKQICMDAGVGDTAQRDDILDLLRNLGLVVSFPRDRKLAHLGVLNPEWVTRAVYPLLMSPETNNSGGILTMDDMDSILPPDRYPRESHGWLLELMEAFELLFESGDGKYLVPSRLPKEIPDWALDQRWLSADTLRVELRYDILPEGVMSRYIVRNHSAGSWGRWWRHGILLENKECKALLRAFPSEGRIAINIRGPSLRRLPFLHAIRAELRRLSNSEDGSDQLWVILPGDHPEKYDDLVLLAKGGHSSIARIVAGQLVNYDLRETLDLVETRSALGQGGHLVEINMRDHNVTNSGNIITLNANSMLVQQTWNEQSEAGVSTALLAEELGRLRKELRSYDTESDVPPDDGERDVAIGQIAAAEAAAKRDDGPLALEKLKGIGKWVGDAATKIGVGVAAKAIESMVGV